METRVTLPFADGDYEFWLPMPRVIAVEREADCSIFALFYNLSSNMGLYLGEEILVGPSDARLKQCHALIRNALVGGGTSEQQARELVETYCAPARPAMHDLALARLILNSAIYGIDTSALDGKKKPEEAVTTGS